MTLVRRPDQRAAANQSWQLDAFGGLPDLVREVDQVFGALASRLPAVAAWADAYPVDLFETGEAVILEMGVPGVQAKDLDISLEGRQLTVQGALPEIEADDQCRYWHQGIPRGQFRRTVTLPASVEPDGIQASVHDGLLRLTMPKVGEARARKIAIAAG